MGSCLILGVLRIGERRRGEASVRGKLWVGGLSAPHALFGLGGWMDLNVGRTFVLCTCLFYRLCL